MKEPCLKGDRGFGSFDASRLTRTSTLRLAQLHRRQAGLADRLILVGAAAADADAT